MMSTPTGFFRSCQGVMENVGHGIDVEQIEYYDPTPAQEQAAEHAHENAWFIVDKYRQAKMTTYFILDMLGATMFTPGINGVFIADTHGTTLQAFDRASMAYDRLPNNAKVPAKAMNRQEFMWSHGGTMRGLTARTDAPGIGRSLDYLVLSELCAWRNQKVATAELFPTVAKRPHARVGIESTPGRRGSVHEGIWRNALEGKGRFKPLFLKWWEDPTCCLPVPDGDKLDVSELRFLERHPFLSYGNLLFRRMQLETYFVGDDRLFSNKYPMGPYDGWFGALNPRMPEDAILGLLDRAVPDPPYDADLYCHPLSPPTEKRQYVVFADPAGYGSGGDPSALTVYDGAARTEVAVWGGVEDPGRFGARCVAVARAYNNALLVVESNAAAAIATIRALGYPYLYFTSPAHPGWYATAPALLAAEAKLVQALRQKTLTIRTTATLHQGLDYDGSRRSARDDEGGHFDRWRTAVMAADVFSLRTFSAPALPAPVRGELPGVVELGSWGVDELDRRKAYRKAGAKNHRVPASRRA